MSSSRSNVDERSLEIGRAVSVVANAIESGELEEKGASVISAKIKSDFATFRSTCRFLSRNSWSAKWKPESVELLKRVRRFHVERLSHAQKEYAREQCAFHCTICGTEESQCHSVIHLLGDVESDFNSDNTLTCGLCELPGVHKQAEDTELKYIGVIVPGCSCLGLCVKTLTSNLMLTRAMAGASGEVEEDAKEIGELWSNLQLASGNSSAVYSKLIPFTEDMAPEFQVSFDMFSQEVASSAGSHNHTDLSLYIETLRRASLLTTANVARIKEKMATKSTQRASSARGGAATSSTSSTSRQEVDLTFSDEELAADTDSEDESESGSWLVDDDEEEEEDGEEDGEEEAVEPQMSRNQRRKQPIRSNKTRRPMVIEDDDEEEEEEEAEEEKKKEPREHPPQPRNRASADADRRETRGRKRAREEEEAVEEPAQCGTNQDMEQGTSEETTGAAPVPDGAQEAIIQASARPSASAAIALRIHPDNALHSREQTLADLLTMAAQFALRPEDLEYVPKLSVACTALAKLLDEKKRGIDHKVDVHNAASTLSFVQHKLVLKGRIAETAPVAAALLVFSEFV